MFAQSSGLLSDMLACTVLGVLCASRNEHGCTFSAFTKVLEHKQRLQRRPRLLYEATQIGHKASFLNEALFHYVCVCVCVCVFVLFCLLVCVWSRDN